MPLPSRNSANVASNFNAILYECHCQVVIRRTWPQISLPFFYECHRQVAIRRTWPQISGPPTPSLLIVAWGQVAAILMRRFVAPIHVVTWNWNSEQRSPIVPLAFSRT